MWSGRLWIVLAATLGAATHAHAETLADRFHDALVIDGLDEPVAVRFSPDHQMFVAEKAGVVKRFDPLPTPGVGEIVLDIRHAVGNYHDRGLLSLALDPAFPLAPYLYVLYTVDAPPGQPTPVWHDQCGASGQPVPTAAGGGCVAGGRLVRYTLRDGRLIEPTILIQNAWYQQYGSHSVGDLRFGRDGMLYVSAGEGAAYFRADEGSADIVSTRDPNPDDPINFGGSFRAQDLITPGDPVGLSGAVLRVDPSTGDAAPGNPLPGDGARIIAFGLRNPFRMAFRPGSDELWLGDVGSERAEEVDRIGDVRDAVVENFGWPCVEGDLRSLPFGDKPLCTQLLDGTLPAGTPGTLRAPYFSYLHGALPGKDELVEPCDAGALAAIVGVAFYTGAAYPDRLRGSFVFSDFMAHCLFAMRPNASGVPDPAQLEVIARGMPALVDIESGPGGDLYYVAISGQIRRLWYEPIGDVNHLHPPAEIAPAIDPPAVEEAVETGCSTSRNGGASLPLLLSMYLILRIKKRY
jgi:glucose/arabinose dehydrogenase